MDQAEPFLDTFYPYRNRFDTFRRIPERGRRREDILAEITAMAAEEDARGDRGQVSGSLYHGDHDHYRFLTEVFGAFAHANVLQRDMYPSATKLEAEIVAMTAAMLHGEAAPDVCGVVTSGGTESLAAQLLAYRERGRQEKGISHPQVILPVTGHVAVDKAAHYFGVEVLHAPLAADWRVDVDWVADHITPNTVALFGSAGNYPHGLVDPIPELGRLALDHGIGLHVDGCLGGFILPWGERLGYPIPPFDFRVPGVTSISADTHKFGFALKGTGVLLFRERALRRRQYFTAAEWPGGIYLSPGMAGSRSGGLIAATWAAMVGLGEEGYLTIAEAIFATAARVRAGIAAIPELEVIGDPTFLVAFRARDGLDIFHVNDALIERGWRLNGLQRPPALHFCVTRPNTAPGVIDRFLADLAEAVDYARHPRQPEPASGALYGLAAAGDMGVAALHQMLEGALDAFYETAP
jgi:glutamate/tyrosine decarboxylase-like PLP-dependent enzyme